MSDLKENAAKFECNNPESTNFSELTGNSKLKITVPQSIIFDKDCNSMRLAVFVYLFVRRGQDNASFFSINTLLNWLHKKTDGRKGRINDKTVELLNHFRKQEFIIYDNLVFEKEKMDENGKLKKVNVWEQFFEMKFNIEKVRKENDESSYTVLYWDEVLSIMNYKNIEKKDMYLNNTVLLLIFSWIRLKIGRRLNRVDEKKRSQDWIEAWECYYIDIANDLGISERMVSKCINILKELGLIYYERIPATKISDEKYRSNHVILVIQYKREGNYLIASGRDYYMNELQKKRETIKVRR